MSLTRNGTPRERAVGQVPGRHLAGGVVHAVHDGVERGVDGVGPGDGRLDQLGGRHLPGADQFGEAEGIVGGVLVMAHGLILALTPVPRRGERGVGAQSGMRAVAQIQGDGCLGSGAPGSVPRGVRVRARAGGRGRGQGQVAQPIPSIQHPSKPHGDRTDGQEHSGATVTIAHSEKRNAATTCKGPFGFHPLLCFPQRAWRIATPYFPLMPAYWARMPASTCATGGEVQHLSGLQRTRWGVRGPGAGHRSPPVVTAYPSWHGHDEGGGRGCARVGRGGVHRLGSRCIRHSQGAGGPLPLRRRRAWLRRELPVGVGLAAEPRVQPVEPRRPGRAGPARGEPDGYGTSAVRVDSPLPAGVVRSRSRAAHASSVTRHASLLDVTLTRG